MSTLGYALLAFASIVFVLCLFRDFGWVWAISAIIFVLGTMLSVAAWYAAQYVPTPDSAGFIVKFEGNVAIKMALITFANIFTFSFPLIGCLIGTRLREKITGRPSLIRAL